jgi:hypothetical protein
MGAIRRITTSCRVHALKLYFLFNAHVLFFKTYTDVVLINFPLGERPQDYLRPQTQLLVRWVFFSTYPQFLLSYYKKFVKLFPTFALRKRLIDRFLIKFLNKKHASNLNLFPNRASSMFLTFKVKCESIRNRSIITNLIYSLLRKESWRKSLR